MSGSINKGSDEKFCHEWGAVIRAKAEICPKCGVRQPLSSSTVSGGGRNRVQAGLFALLLGGVGVHKFYLGRTGQGIVYLLFCWTFIPAIIGFIEGLIYLSMSDENFARKYG
jgi:TM2 domain